MARGERSEHNPARQVGPHRWRGIAPWEVTQPGLGKLTSVSNYNLEGRTGIEMGAWEGEKGHTAEVREHLVRYSFSGYPEFDEDTYTAGPFRTQRRAQIAAGGLARRVEGGRAEAYR